MGQYSDKAWIDLKMLREAKGWLQADVAERLGVSREYVSFMENGRRAISRKNFQGIIDAYGATYEDFHTHARLLPGEGARLENIPLAITVWDQNYNLIDCAEYMVNYLGFSGKQDLLDRLVSLAPEYQPDGRDSRAVFSEGLRHALETGYSYLSWTYQPDAGKPVNLDILMARMMRGDSPVVVAYARDMSENIKIRSAYLKQYEAVLQSLYLNGPDSSQAGTVNLRQYNSMLLSRIQLQEQTDWYKTVLDVLPFPVRVADANKNWKYMNSAAASFMQERREDLLGKPCAFKRLSICGTDNCGLTRAKRGIQRTDFEHDGSPHHIEVKMLRNGNGEFSGFLEVILPAAEAKNAPLASEPPRDAINFMEESSNRFERIHGAGRILLETIKEILEISAPQ